MNKNIIVTDNKIQINKPIELLIEYDENTVRLVFNTNKNNEIIFSNNTKLLVDGDFYIASKGELGLFTKGSNLCMDSIGGNIYLNSRMANIHKNDPEAIEYRENINKQTECKYGDLLSIIEELKGRITTLEREINKPI